MAIYPNDSGTPRTLRWEDDDDEYPRDEPGWERGLQPHRSLLIEAIDVVVLGCRILQPNTGQAALEGGSNRARVQAFSPLGGVCGVLH